MKEFVCDICQETFSNKDLLTSHKIIHAMKMDELEIKHENLQENHFTSSSFVIKTEECIFSCPECDLVFVHKEHLDHHISSLHVKMEFEIPYEEVIVTENALVKTDTNLETKPHVCKICFKDFDQISNLKDHMHICSKDFTTKKGLLSDLEKVEKTAEIKFTRSEHLNRHKLIYTEEKPYTCDICNKKFTRLSNLKNHKKTHTGEELYECDICNKKFSTFSALKRHKRTHTGEKPYKCDVCKNNFLNLSALKRHKIFHTGEKPHECDLCNKKFSVSSDLKRHKFIHMVEKPHKCDVCNKTFSASTDLKRHKIFHTGEKPYECDVCNKKYFTFSSLKCHKIFHMNTY